MNSIGLRVGIAIFVFLVGQAYAGSASKEREDADARQRFVSGMSLWALSSISRIGPDEGGYIIQRAGCEFEVQIDSKGNRVKPDLRVQFMKCNRDDPEFLCRYVLAVFDEGAEKNKDSKYYDFCRGASEKSR